MTNLAHDNIRKQRVIALCRMKSLIDSERKEFQLDYFEYCAKEVYDNPEKPEDIW